MNDTERELLDRACVLEKENAELRECLGCAIKVAEGHPIPICLIEDWKATLAKASGEEVE